MERKDMPPASAEEKMSLDRREGEQTGRVRDQTPGHTFNNNITAFPHHLLRCLKKLGFVYNNPDPRGSE